MQALLVLIKNYYYFCFHIIIIHFYLGLEHISLKDVIFVLWRDTQSYVETKFQSLRFEDIKEDLYCSTYKTIFCFLIGLLVTISSWTVVYLDSDIPGINPPTPLSPRNNRTGNSLHVKSSYSLGYLMSIINGVAVFLFLLISS